MSVRSTEATTSSWICFASQGAVGDRMLPRDIIAAETLAFRMRPIRWKRATEHFVSSHCGFWHITPIYGGLTRPESYELWFGASTRRRVGSGQTQRECKAVAESM